MQSTEEEEVYKLADSWVFWESHKGKHGKKDWNACNKEIIGFDNLNKFQQIWHNSPLRTPYDLFFDRDNSEVK